MHRKYGKIKGVIIFLIFFLILLLITSFFIHNKNITGKVVKEEIIKEFSTIPEVYFCPKDKCDERLVEFINSANNSIYCAFFDLDLENVINALDEKSKNIDVKVVVDKDNYKDVENLTFVKLDNRYAYMHNKFCVADKRIFTGSFNPTKRDVYYNNNNIMIINSEYLADNYEKEFLELWNDIFGKGYFVKNPVIYLNDKRIENYFCPEDSCAEHIEEELNTSKESIYFLTFSFTHGGIATEIIKKINQGIKVKGVFEKLQNSEYSKKDLLAFQGADVKFDNNPYNMHHKVFIIDGKTVITGSFNPSKNADEDNDENILIIDDEDIAKKYLEEFDYVWQYNKTKLI